ncbi:translation initiation factor eIF 4e-like domain-containing protein [Glomus cerebriforme]|uniref:Translation initiation factor eIF 4e-like domain-containing protein n=1 Tax=Glomus cerebriforme TaxID=658196 RepID=A0A397SGC0_9GLOM|nr:translation initiation factor eIF 4e-like domain-containing protein [Glomus cerebriforme]
MPSEHSRSSSSSSVTSPIPTINVKLVKPNGKDGGNGHGQSNSSSRGSNSELLDIINARTGQSKDKNSRDKSPSRDRSPSRGKSPGRSKSSDKRGKSPSGRKSPSGDKLLNSPRSPGSRSRSPGPRSKSPNHKESSKSPRSSSHNRIGSDNSMNRSSSQDARFSMGSRLQPWIAPSLSSEKGGNSKNRLSLPPNFAEFNINSIIRESNERWARSNLVPNDKDSKTISMGNFSKSTSHRTLVNPIARPKLSVETFNSLLGSGVPLTRSRSHNSAMDDTKRYLKDEKPHPLQHKWTMYYDSKPVTTPGPKTPTGKHTYEENLQTIGTFDTVQSFCRYFNWVKKPSQLEINTNFHIFKDKIKPMWEDPANANGGKWVISMKSTQLLDRCWTWLVYALVGEELDENDDICGAVMSRRVRGDRIAVWVRDKDNVPVINGIGRRLLKILDLQNEKGIGMDFQFNEDALKSGTSYNNRVYLSLESLKQELEGEERAKQEELANVEKRQNEVQKNEDDSSNAEKRQNEVQKNDDDSSNVEINVSTPEIVTVDVDAESDAMNGKNHNLDEQKDDENGTNDTNNNGNNEDNKGNIKDDDDKPQPEKSEESQN